MILPYVCFENNIAIWCTECSLCWLVEQDCGQRQFDALLWIEDTDHVCELYTLYDSAPSITLEECQAACIGGVAGLFEVTAAEFNARTPIFPCNAFSHGNECKLHYGCSLTKKKTSETASYYLRNMFTGSGPSQPNADLNAFTGGSKAPDYMWPQTKYDYGAVTWPYYMYNGMDVQGIRLTQLVQAHAQPAHTKCQQVHDRV